jgi:hypothetical protein
VKEVDATPPHYESSTIHKQFQPATGRRYQLMTMCNPVNRLVLFFALTLCLPISAHADDASRRAKAEEILTLLHMDRMSTQLMGNLLQQTTEITARKSAGAMTPATQAALADFQKKLVAFIEPQIGWKAIEPEYVKQYADTFTDEELDAMLAYYKSPAGTAFLTKMPGIDKQVNETVRSRIVALQPQVNQMIAEFEKTVAPPAAPASTPPLTLKSLPPASATTPAPATAPPSAPAKGPQQ